MTHTCLRDEELAVVAERPDNERRQEIEQCASCRSRLAAFRSFLRAADVPPGARPAEADARLGDTLEAEIFGAAGRQAGAEGSSRKAAPTGRIRRGRSAGEFLRHLWRPRLRPAWGAAVVLLAFLGVRSTGLLGPPRPHEPILRDGGGATGAAIELNEPALEASGAVRLSWVAPPESDRYEVILHGPGFVEKIRLDAGPEPACTVPVELIGRLAAPRDPLYWRVVAYHGGDRIAESRIAPLALAPPR